MRPLAHMYERHINVIRQAFPRAQLPMDVWQCDTGVPRRCTTTGELIELVGLSGFIKVSEGDNGLLRVHAEIDETPAPGQHRRQV